MSEIARETILAIAYFLQAGKENSQNRVLIYFERTAIGKPDSVIYLSTHHKSGFPACCRSKVEIYHLP